MEGLIWLAERAGDHRPVEGFLLAMPVLQYGAQTVEGTIAFDAKDRSRIYSISARMETPNTHARVSTLGVEGEVSKRQSDSESAMLIEGLRVGFDAGVRESEASWILEDNVMMCRVMEAIGGKPYKTYRLYRKEI